MKKLIVVLFLLQLCASGFTQDVMMPDVAAQPDNNTPAPVYDVTITVKDNYKILLRWRSAALPDESFFTIERGSNGVDFAPVSVIKKTSAGADFEFVDDAPIRGKVFYRVKFTTSQAVFYSGVTSTVLSTDASCRFYPNPVDKVLIVRSEIPVEVQIADRFGKPVITNRLAAGLKLVDVSSLAPGVYIITLFQKDSNRVITEKLVKK